MQFQSCAHLARGPSATQTDLGRPSPAPFGIPLGRRRRQKLDELFFSPSRSSTRPSCSQKSTGAAPANGLKTRDEAADLEVAALGRAHGVLAAPGLVVGRSPGGGRALLWTGDDASTRGSAALLRPGAPLGPDAAAAALATVTTAVADGGSRRPSVGAPLILVPPDLCLAWSFVAEGRGGDVENNGSNGCGVRPPAPSPLPGGPAGVGGAAAAALAAAGAEWPLVLGEWSSSPISLSLIPFTPLPPRRPPPPQSFPPPHVPVSCGRAATSSPREARRALPRPLPGSGRSIDASASRREWRGGRPWGGG